jgi:peroxiredoxin
LYTPRRSIIVAGRIETTRNKEATMALTPSVMVDLGTKAPDFSLPDTNGNTVKRSDFEGKPLLVMFICNHCPFVKHLRDHIAETCRTYQDKGVSVVGISSNDVVNFPDDSLEKMAEEAKDAGYTFPYLFDDSQDVALAYQAACTPDFFLYDRDHNLVYRGRYDESRPDSGIPVTGTDLKAALDSILGGNPVSPDQKSSIGCNIKWKAGKEPSQP